MHFKIKHGRRITKQKFFYSKIETTKVKAPKNGLEQFEPAQISCKQQATDIATLNLSIPKTTTSNSKTFYCAMT